MSARGESGPIESWIGSALVLAAGAGTLVALSGALTAAVPVAAAGGAVLGLALTALLAAGWIDGLALVVLTLPLPALYGSNSVRIATVAPVTAAVVGAWLLSRAVSGRGIRTGTLPMAWLTALVGVFALTTVTAQHRLTSVREILNFAVLFGFMMAATDVLAQDRRRVARCARLLVMVGAACGALGVLEMVQVIPGAFPRFDTPFNRAALGFGQPNGLGLFLAVVLPFAIHEWVIARDVGDRAFAALVIVLVAAGLTATFSRGSWLAVFAGAGVLLFTGNARSVLRVWAGFLVVAIIADLVTGGAMRDTVERTIGDWVIEQRAALMLAGLAMFAAYPLTGVGPGGYADSLERFGPQIAQLWDYLPTPHNAYVQMAAETGLIGLIVFVGFLGATLAVQIRRTRAEETDARAGRETAALNRALLWSFATACAAGMVVWPFAHGTGQAVMLLVAGIHALRAPPGRPAIAGRTSASGAAPTAAGSSGSSAATRSTTRTGNP